ncbi:50S ribosomal protein L2 [candidate division KSB1 bacterium]
MALKKYNPTTPGQRFKTDIVREFTTDEPEKSLTVALPKKGGRNNTGRITARHRGGGHKRKYRIIDFKRDKHGIPGKVHSIEYDPNRTTFISLLHYSDGEKRYILCPVGLKVDDVVFSGPDSEIRVGNSLPLAKIPLGTFVHNVEFRPKKGGQIARSAGSAVQLMAKEGKYAILRMPSGEMRKVMIDCYATIGQLSNLEHLNVSLGKAGRSRWLGRRPHTRGVAMNPHDHPMGGGEGKSSGGRHPCTPWGKPTKGYKTRSKQAAKNKLIIKRKK